MQPPRNLLYQSPHFVDVFAVFCFVSHHRHKTNGLPFGVCMEATGEIVLCLVQGKHEYLIEKVHSLLEAKKEARIRAHVYEAWLDSGQEKKSVLRIQMSSSNLSKDLVFYIPTEHRNAWWVEEAPFPLFSETSQEDKN